MGILPGLEVSLDMLQVIGWVDPEAPGVAWAMHRLSNLKYQLPLPADWPQIAFGAQDPLSVNAISRGPIGQTDYGLTTYYVVASHAVGPVSLHLGYARSRDFIDGVFGGATWRSVTDSMCGRSTMAGNGTPGSCGIRSAGWGYRWPGCSRTTWRMGHPCPGDCKIET